MALFTKPTLASITATIEKTITDLDNHRSAKLEEVSVQSNMEATHRANAAVAKAEAEKAGKISQNLRALLDK